MATAWTTAERTRRGQALGRGIRGSGASRGIASLPLLARYTGRRYIHGVAIRSFEDKATEKFFLEGRVAAGAGWGPVRNVVRRKLDMLHYAAVLSDLKSPPGNRLETLRGNLAGFYSVRINDRWRVVFEWTADGPARVRVTDYH
jgi:proteic killer suppression protein